MKRCLYCYKELGDEVGDYHFACSKVYFGKPVAPEFSYVEKDLPELGLQVIRSHYAVTGVQPKISLSLQKGENKDAPMRLTIVGFDSKYILKPQTDLYPHLPEVEDLSMHLAAIAGISTVPHTLIRTKSNNLAYITTRIDRLKKARIHMEDMCQLTERLTEHKYHGSHEQIGKTISKYSQNPGLDLVNFYEQVLFSFLIGNADMHLKNFSLLADPDLGYTLAPAYDLVSTALVLPSDTEDLALTLNGKKKKLRLSDFMKAMTSNGIPEKAQRNIVDKMEAAVPEIIQFIDYGFLPKTMKELFQKIISDRAHRLYFKKV
ncbi:MAG: HipA domain-containing protein [Bacteroidales bacterium]|jgi:serine/threonine-protein kinase HipA|nr:HipA domain-containing protein [Bacteroidales bacterium]HPF01502.1 HipA domain-containing protein [Bacteroidales bacterium]